MWALLIQGLYSDENFDDLSVAFGERLVLEADYTAYLRDLASKKLRFIISDAVSDDRFKKLIADEKYSFLRTKATFQRCMARAKDKYGWQKKSI